MVPQYPHMVPQGSILVPQCPILVPLGPILGPQCPISEIQIPKHVPNAQNVKSSIRFLVFCFLVSYWASCWVSYWESYVKNSIGHNLTHMARQNFLPPRFGTEFRCGPFWFPSNHLIFRAPGPGPRPSAREARGPGPGPGALGPRSEGPGPWPRARIGAPIYIFGPNLYIGPQLGPQFVYWAPIWAPI